MLVNEDNIEEVFEKYEWAKDLEVKDAKGFTYVGDKLIDGMLFLKSLIKEGEDNKIYISTEHDTLIYRIRLESLYEGFCDSDVQTLCHFQILYDDEHDYFYVFT